MLCVELYIMGYDSPSFVAVAMFCYLVLFFASFGTTLHDVVYCIVTRLVSP